MIPNPTGTEPTETSGVVKIVETSPGAYVIGLAGETFDVFRLEDGTLTDGNLLPSVTIEVETPRSKLVRTHFGGGTAGGGRNDLTGRLTIKSPMPGLVRAVRVAVGDIVSKDTTVLVLEAMKMENNIVAGVLGKVTALFAQPGISVDKNSPLVEIERLP